MVGDAVHVDAVNMEQATEAMMSSFSGGEEAITFNLTTSMKRDFEALFREVCE